MYINLAFHWLDVVTDIQFQRGDTFPSRNFKFAHLMFVILPFVVVFLFIAVPANVGGKCEMTGYMSRG